MAAEILYEETLVKGLRNIDSRVQELTDNHHQLQKSVEAMGNKLDHLQSTMERFITEFRQNSNGKGAASESEKVEKSQQEIGKNSLEFLEQLQNHENGIQQELTALEMQELCIEDQLFDKMPELDIISNRTSLQVGRKITQTSGMDQFKSYEDAIKKSHGEGVGVFQLIVGPENWPLQVLNQQPRNLSALLQKLHSSDVVHEAVIRGCKEQQRQIKMNLMLGDIPHLLDLIWSWISPSEDDRKVSKLHDDPQMIRFGAHLVLVLRYLLAEEMRDAFKKKIMILGNLILHMYAIFLFSKQHEELVEIYVSQLARHCCFDFFVHMMELRLNERVHVKYKIFLSAIENLLIAAEDESKGSFEEIIERVLSRDQEK